METVVIFGASGGAEKVAQTFHDLGMEIDSFVDNNEAKCGKKFFHKKINSPIYLTKNNHEIVIASIYQEEIEKQLNDMGISHDRIVPKEKYILTYINDHINDFENSIMNKQIAINPRRSYIFDLAEGMQIGGVESWSYNFMRLLKEKGEECVAFSKVTEDSAPTDLVDSVLQLDIKYESYLRSIMNIVDKLVLRMPFTMVANWMTQNFYAAYILKLLFPNQVRILAGVHQDMLGYYRRDKYIEDCVDAFLCVSSGIKKRMLEEFDVISSKVYYAPVPLKHLEIEDIVGQELDKPLKICFGARLVKAQKRVDYIIPLIRRLEDRGINYRFYIAGDGEYFSIIQEYVVEHNLSDKIFLLGKVKPEKMSEFWKDKEIIISLSDSEGMGLSILEAMSCGVMPIVTDTAGIREFVVDDYNGYVVDFGDVDEIASKIEQLEKDKEKIYQFRKNSINIIKEKCIEENYYNILKKVEDDAKA